MAGVAAAGQGPTVGMWRMALLALLVLLGTIEGPALAAPRAQDGVLDLRGWDFDRDGSLLLEGDWQFWRDRLVDPASIAAGTAPPPARLAVPGRWGNQSVDGQPLATEGVGTYHLRVLLPPGAPPVALRHNQRFVAWDVFVNGKRALHAGTVGPDAARTDSVGQQAIAAVAPVADQLDIVVQVAAFGGYGGMPRALLLGDVATLYGHWQGELALRAAFLSLCLSIGLLYLILFLLRPSDRQCLVFATMSLAIGMVQVTANTPLGSELTGAFAGRLLALLNNIMFPAVWLSCLASAALMFPGCMRRSLLWPTILVITLVPLASLWTLEYPFLLTWVATAGLVLAMLTLLSVAVTAMRQRQSLALPMAVAWLVMGGANLALVHRLGFTGIMEAGYCFMLFLQAALLIDRLRRLLDQARQANDRLAALNGSLEGQVAERTRHLSDMVEKLQLAQTRIVQSEKLASLGRLVAGVAHEVNTPVGTALTMATHLLSQVDQSEKAMATGALTRRQLDEFLAETKEAAGLITTSIQRAAAIVQSFKQVAADRTDDRRRLIDLGEMLAELRPALEARLAGTNVSLQVSIAPGLVVDISPGALSQATGQVIANSLDHAFPEGQPGTIAIQAHRLADGMVELVLEDDGVGLPTTIQERLFEPFSTTARGDGKAGLGLHMVYALVTGPLDGTVSIGDRDGGGTRVTIRLPSAGDSAGMPAIIT